MAVARTRLRSGGPAERNGEQRNDFGFGLGVGSDAGRGGGARPLAFPPSASPRPAARRPPKMVSALEFLPPASSFAWILALYVQAVLLHPRVPAGLSRVLRALLTPLVVSLAWNAPGKGFHPRDVTRGFNAGFAFMSLYGVAKALEWGLATDRAQFDFVGFGAEAVKLQDKEKQAEKHGKPVNEDKVTVARRSQSWIKVLLSQAHLLFAFRMLGYRFFTGKPPKPLTTATFLRRTILRAIGTHIGFTLAMAFVTSEVGDRRVYLVALVPWLLRHPAALKLTSNLVAFTSIGVLAWNGLALAHALLSLSFYALHGLGKVVGLPVDSFDPREFPPLFKHPYRPTSVARLWVKTTCFPYPHPLA